MNHTEKDSQSLFRREPVNLFPSFQTPLSWRSHMVCIVMLVENLCSAIYSTSLRPYLLLFKGIVRHFVKQVYLLS